MKKIKLVKVVVPEIVAYFGPDQDSLEPDFICPTCDHGVAKDYSVCPYCGSELDWKHTTKPSKKFIELFRRF